MTTTAKATKAQTKRVNQSRKETYWLIEDDNHTTIIATRHYNDDLAIMAAMRKLKNLKKINAAPSHATLYRGFSPETYTRVQGFKRT